MTKAQARELYLRYLGERTVNGGAKADLDLNDVFDGLLGAAVMEVGRARPTRGLFEVKEEDKQPEGRFFVKDVPLDHAYIMRTVDEYGLPVAYQRVKDQYWFVRPCKVEYALRPAMILPGAADSTTIDLDDNYAQLVPLQCAISAALGLEEFQYKVPALQAQYNTMLDALDDTDMPTYRRVY